MRSPIRFLILQQCRNALDVGGITCHVSISKFYKHQNQNNGQIEITLQSHMANKEKQGNQ